MKLFSKCNCSPCWYIVAMTFIFKNAILVQSKGFCLFGRWGFFFLLVLLYVFELHNKLRLNLMKLDKLL